MNNEHKSTDKDQDNYHKSNERANDSGSITGSNLQNIDLHQKNKP